MAVNVLTVVALCNGLQQQ